MRPPTIARQRKEPVGASGRTHDIRHQADVQSRSTEKRERPTVSKSIGVPKPLGSSRNRRCPSATCTPQADWHPGSWHVAQKVWCGCGDSEPSIPHSGQAASSCTSWNALTRASAVWWDPDRLAARRMRSRSAIPTEARTLTVAPAHSMARPLERRHSSETADGTFAITWP